MSCPYGQSIKYIFLKEQDSYYKIYQHNYPLSAALGVYSVYVSAF